MTRGTRWSNDEVEFIRANADSMTAQQIADHLGRTYHSVIGKAKQDRIAIRHQGRFVRDSFTSATGSIQIGSRQLIAKTCTGCGRLLPARRFGRHQSGRTRGCWFSRCIGCAANKNYAKEPAAIEGRRAQYEKLQAYTEPLAFAKGTPWSNADVGLVKDTSKSLLEVAVTAGRTYQSVASRASQEGVQRRLNPDQHKNWIVQLQRASVEAAFGLEPMDPTGIPREEDWDWDERVGEEGLGPVPART